MRTGEPNKAEGRGRWQAPTSPIVRERAAIDSSRTAKATTAPPGRHWPMDVTTGLREIPGTEKQAEGHHEAAVSQIQTVGQRQGK